MKLDSFRNEASRRVTAICLAIVMLVAAIALPAAAQNDSHGQVVQSVTGSAHWKTPDGFLRRFSFFGRKFADGFVDGEWNMVAGSAILHGTVTCMNVLSPNEARLGGTVDQSKFSLFQAGTEIGWLAVDNGQGVNAPDDMTSNLRAFRNAPTGTAERFCLYGELPFPGSDLGVDDITRGHTQIHF
jgi:hypothetical protein